MCVRVCTFVGLCVIALSVVNVCVCVCVCALMCLNSGFVCNVLSL